SALSRAQSSYTCGSDTQVRPCPLLWRTQRSPRRPSPRNSGSGCTPHTHSHTSPPPRVCCCRRPACPLGGLDVRVFPYVCVSKGPPEQDVVKCSKSVARSRNFDAPRHFSNEAPRVWKTWQCPSLLDFRQQPVAIIHDGRNAVKERLCHDLPASEG